MTKLEQLIEELCPNGVEYHELGKIAEMRRGTSITKKNVCEGEIPVISGGREPAYYCDTFNREGATITVAGSGAGAGYVQYWDRPIFVCDAFSIKGNERLSTKYLYYFLTSIQEFIYSTKKGGGVPHVHVSSIEHVQIPVPPLPVQSEIVRILDNFTELTTELTAELTARKKQYEFYRDKLLTISNEQVAMCNLGDICESIADGDHMPPPKADTGIPFITISNITEQNKIDFSNTMFVPHAYYDSLAEKRKPQKGDILYTVVGSYGIPVCIEEDSEFVFQRHIAILRPKKQIVKPRYMFHAMQSSAFKAQAGKTAKGAAQKTIGLAALAAMKMPVPTLDVQNRLVNVLDNFDAICSDLKIGLPAEIEARQKQYEFYRDALLTYAATGKIILTDRQTDRQGLIKLFWYVFGYINVRLEDVVAHKCSGATPNKAEPDYYRGGTIPWIRTQDVRFNEITEVDSYITEKAVTETAAKWIPENCVIVAISGASAGRCAINKIRATTNQHCLNLEIDASLALYRYVFHCVCRGYDDMISKKQGARGDLNSSLILSTIIPLPSLDRQREIVDLLDQFDRICNDLSDGLPAEIEARRQQYEYYRDTLLTFEAQ